MSRTMSPHHIKCPDRNNLPINPYPTPPSSTASSSKHLGVPSCEITYLSGKGHGLSAIRNIHRGEEVCREKPFIWFSLPIASWQVDIAYNRLTDKEKILFLSFTASISGITHVWTNIAETNGIDMSNPEDLDEQETDHLDDLDDADQDGETAATAFDVRIKRGRCGVFKTISRVNHSCRPNSGWSFDTTTQDLVLIAHTNIASGAEITASYRSQDLLIPRKQRQANLSAAFGFHCCCSACSMPHVDAAKSDRRAATLHQLEAQFDAEDFDIIDFAWDRGRALSQMDKAVQLAKEEGLVTLQPELLEKRFMVEAAWGLQNKARRAAKESVDLYRLLRGRWRGAGDIASWKSNPEGFWAWNEARRLNGGKISTSDDGESDFETHWSKKKRKRS